MRQLGIKGLPGPRKGVKNLKNAPTCEDLVQRNFRAAAPNELWLTDITEHETQEGKLYCCVVLDMYSRRVVGWAIDRRCEAALVNDALAKASASRPTSPSTIVHSDHGSQFTSWAFTENVRRLGLVSSMGTVGDCYDNAPMESFWGSMQVELLDRQRWRTKLELAIAIADYIEHFYNPPGDTARRLPHPERIRRPTLTRTPGHVVMRRGPLNGIQAKPRRGRDLNPRTQFPRSTH